MRKVFQGRDTISFYKGREDELLFRLRWNVCSAQRFIRGFGNLDILQDIWLEMNDLPELFKRETIVTICIQRVEGTIPQRKVSLIRSTTTESFSNLRHQHAQLFTIQVTAVVHIIGLKQKLKTLRGSAFVESGEECHQLCETHLSITIHIQYSVHMFQLFSVTGERRQHLGEHLLECLQTDSGQIALIGAGLHVRVELPAQNLELVRSEVSLTFQTHDVATHGRAMDL
mmetsp:Transcript_17747/g.45194  ORF Transcript_17747/g.45194 Transcript_17747/m.45194 type:complete len:228 (+) Transcript_17747:423-1106(+)